MISLTFSSGPWGPKCLKYQNVPHLGSFWAIGKPWERFQRWDIIIYFIAVLNDHTVVSWLFMVFGWFPEYLLKRRSYPECFLETFWKGSKNLGRALPPSSKHLKGRLDPPVGDVTFLHQRRSVESSFAPKCTWLNWILAQRSQSRPCRPKAGFGLVGAK